MNGSMTWRLRLLAVGFCMVAAAPAALVAQDGQNQQGQGNRRVRGQGGPGGGQAMNPVQTVERSREDVMGLNLKDDQKTKLDAIFKEAADQAKSLETEVASMEPRERFQKIQPFTRDLREKVSGVLDDEQKAALRKKSAERQGKQNTERWKRALDQLNLTAEQKTKVDAVLADAQKKIEAQAAEPGAGQGAGQGAGPGNGGRGPGGGRFGATMQETRQKIQEILTPEQQQKLTELMPQRGRGGQRGGAGNQQ